MSIRSSLQSRIQKFDALLPKETVSPEETMALGEALASELQPGDVVALYGDLGAGKTHLIKGISKTLGVPGQHVTSPTFTIVHEYEGTRMPVYHFDAYRIQNPHEFFELGYEDYFFGNGLCLIEWPEHVESLLPGHTIRLRLSHRGRDRRRIELVEDGK